MLHCYVRVAVFLTTLTPLNEGRKRRAMRAKVEIPTDTESSSAFDSEQCFALYYGPTKEVVEAKAKGYMETYSPQGYDTIFAVPPLKHSLGYWWCKLTRRCSCD